MRRLIILFSCVVLFGASCARFHNAPAESKDARYVVISPIYNEIIWALGAQNTVVGIDLSTTYPPEVKNVQTVGYHRALSAEGILSLHPTAIIHDNNIGPPQVVQQLQQLNIPMKTFTAKNDSFDGTKALIREMGAYFQKESRAEELCNTLDTQRTASLEKVKQYTDHPRVAVIHFGRASNVYLVVGKGSGGDGGGGCGVWRIERLGAYFRWVSGRARRQREPRPGWPDGVCRFWQSGEVYRHTSRYANSVCDRPGRWRYRHSASADLP